MEKINFIKGGKLDIINLIDLSQKPPVFTQGEPLFWNDEHISKEMLKYHLNPEVEGASRRHKTIEDSVNFLSEYIKLKKGDRILDLGCGPGLYSSRFYNKGANVTGIDYSISSINYAKETAEEMGMDIEYIYGDYTDMGYPEKLDYIFLIYYDFGALSDAKRDAVLKRVGNSLKEGGRFIFDVLTPVCFTEDDMNTSWNSCEEGFWKSSPYLVLDQSFNYPESGVHLNQHIVIDDEGDIKVYRNYDHYYKLEEITEVLENFGFFVEEVWEDLTGNQYGEASKSIGIAAKKK